MGKKIINILKWEKIAEKIEKTNKDFFKVIQPIAEDLKKNSRDYAYKMELSFGEELIFKGKSIILKTDEYDKYVNIDSYIFKNDNNENIDWKDQFIEDCKDYTDHPLSIVTEGFVEIFYENTFESTKKIDYYFPLNIIEKADLFGVFGALHFINKREFMNIEQPWSAVGGRRCIISLLPEQDCSYEDKFKKGLQTLLDVQFLKEEIFDKYHNLLNYFLKNNNLTGDWKSEIIFFPVFWLKDIKNKKTQENTIFEPLKCFLYKKGWNQVVPLTDFVFENKIIYEKVEGITSPEIESHFLSLYYDYLLKASNGSALLLTLVNTKDNIVYDIYSELKNIFNNNNNLQQSYHPVLFKYGKLNDDNKWGISPVINPPIISIIKHKRQISNIVDAIYCVNKHFTTKGMLKYVLQNPKFYISSSSNNTDLINKTRFFEDYLFEFTKPDSGDPSETDESPKCTEKLYTKHPLFQNFVLFEKDTNK